MHTLQDHEQTGHDWQSSRQFSRIDNPVWLLFLQDSSNRSRDADAMKARFKAAVTLHHFKEAWDAALMLKSPQLWQALGEAYLHALDVDSAIR